MIDTFCWLHENSFKYFQNYPSARCNNYHETPIVLNVSSILKRDYTRGIYGAYYFKSHILLPNAIVDLDRNIFRILRYATDSDNLVPLTFDNYAIQINIFGSDLFGFYSFARLF